MIDIRSIINQLLLPRHCLLCGADSNGKGLCDGCHDDLPRPGGPCCSRCGLSLGSGTQCAGCLKAPPAFVRTVAACDYTYPLDAMLQRYKYHGRLEVAEIAAGLLASRLAGVPCPDLLIPMPLHATRLAERGFNQAAEIARLLGKQLDVPVNLGACRRIRITTPQAGLSLRRRMRNLRGAFDCRCDLVGLRIALVDDVMTSGASLGELARVVRQAGASEVECWVVARTQRH